MSRIFPALACVSFRALMARKICSVRFAFSSSWSGLGALRLLGVWFVSCSETFT